MMAHTCNLNLQRLRQEEDEVEASLSYRMTLNFWSTGLYFPSAGITDVVPTCSLMRL